MDKLSNLIKEAKPLYQKRKKQKKALVSMCLAIIPLFLFTSFLNLYSQGENLYLALSSDDYAMEFLNDEYGLNY